MFIKFLAKQEQKTPTSARIKCGVPTALLHGTDNIRMITHVRAQSSFSAFLYFFVPRPFLCKLFGQLGDCCCLLTCWAMNKNDQSCHQYFFSPQWGGHRVKISKSHVLLWHFSSRLKHLILILIPSLTFSIPSFTILCHRIVPFFHYYK